MTLRPVSMADMTRIFEVTDALGISRESITVPLAPAGEGDIERLASGKVQITVPRDLPLDTWLPRLRERLVELGLAGKA